MEEKSLLAQLQNYAVSDTYPMHMPGHKRNVSMLQNGLPYQIDITEIDGFDNLHQPEGILKSLSERLQNLYQSACSVPLINGSTCGILAGVASVFSFGGSILMARNCHKSLYNAVQLLGLTPYYLVPPVDQATGIAGSILPSDVQEALEAHPDIQLVALTSPTYDGVLSDIQSIVQIAHKHNVPVLVDEAHGAHLQFTELAAYSAVPCGADIVIQSLHKTLPAMTQVAVAHIQGNLVSADEFKKKCAVFETSSPSYVLLASIEACVAFLEQHGQEVFLEYAQRLSAFSKEMTSLSHLCILCKGNDSLQNHPTFFAFDAGKLPIVTVQSDIDGEALLERLRKEAHIECEMAALTYALAMTSVCDSDLGFARLKQALLTLDADVHGAKAVFSFETKALPAQICSPFAAARKKGAFLDLQNAVGKMALDYLFCYPPGIPLLVPGERITEELQNEIHILKSSGLAVQTGDKRLPKIYACD